MSRHGSFVGFGYRCNGMFKLNIDVPFVHESVCMASCSSITNMTKSEIWHARLRHVHYKRLKDMSKSEIWHARLGHVLLPLAL